MFVDEKKKYLHLFLINFSISIRFGSLYFKIPPLFSFMCYQPDFYSHEAILFLFELKKTIFNLIRKIPPFFEFDGRLWNLISI